MIAIAVTIDMANVAFHGLLLVLWISHKLIWIINLRKIQFILVIQVFSENIFTSKFLIDF